MMSRLLGLEKAVGVATPSEIREWGRKLHANRDEILKALEADTGKNEAEGYLLEWIPVESAIKFLEENVEAVFNPKLVPSAMRPLLGRRVLVQRRLPLGHVLIVGTWNFPLSLHLVQILFAAAAGNKVTFKNSPYSSALGRAFGKILPGILGSDRFTHWVPQADSEVMDGIRRRDFDLVIFTGGSAVAKLFAKVCAEAMVPLVAEASGSEVALMLEQSARSGEELRRRIDHLLWALYHHAGQTCVSPRFWFVPKSKFEEVWLTSIEMLDSVPESIETRSKLQHERVGAEHKAWQEWAMKLPGAERARSKHREEFSLIRLPSMKDLPTETPGTFGPSAIITPYERLEDVVAWTNKSPWSLLTTILGEPTAEELKKLSPIDTTIVSINEAVAAAGDAAVPFGGRGASGYGVCHGIDGLLSNSRVQTWQHVIPWPGAALLKAVPSWTDLPRLRKLGAVLKTFEDSPVRAVKEFFS